MIRRILTFSFYLLFFLTPLVWTSVNYELFEYNKMIFVYILTIIISGTWVIGMVKDKELRIKRTPLDIPLLLFLGANILSAIFSIDPHTSWWGYYSRSNGGVLSLVSYIVLYYALVSNFKFEEAINFLKSALLGGLIVSLWAIPEHFGISPSCIVLTAQFSADCWVQDVQARVFATLGQPNWLAAYLEMLIFPAIYFFQTAKHNLSRITYLILLIIYYLAFTFTYSRGATLGIIAGIGVFIVSSSSTKGFRFPIWLGMTVLGAFLVINLLFGSALTDFKLLSKFAPPPRPGLGLSSGSSSSTQLENGGTESGKIRLIVWKGALEVFKHYPIFGSGVETFAYSYYNFRPAAHNLVSEWDFLYNKAHNEFLNYLATTGILGFGTYMMVIITFIGWSVLRIFNFKISFFNKGFKLQLSKLEDNKLITHHSSLITLSLLASYIAYLIQNFFGFSVVIIALFFYIFPAFSFLASDSIYDLKISKKLIPLRFIFNSIVYKRPIYTKVTLGFLLVVTGYLLLTIIKYWYADTLFAKGSNYSNAGNPGRAYNNLIDAVQLNYNEPFYHNELGFAAAAASGALASEDATLSAKLKDLSTKETELSLKISPKNVSYWRTAIRTYYELATLDSSFYPKTLETLDKSLELAPTDPKLYYHKALILDQLERIPEAIGVMQEAITLKPNYRDGYYSIGVFYHEMMKKDPKNKDFWMQKALDVENTVLKLIPNDPDGLKVIDEINKEATASSY